MGIFNGPEAFRYKVSAALTVMAIAVLACGGCVPPAVTAVPSPANPAIGLPTEAPIESPTLQEMPTALPSTELPIQPSTEAVPSVTILYNYPQIWMTGEDNAQVNERMSETIKADISARPDQYAAASEVLPEDYLNAVVNIEFETDPSNPMGGTATFIGINYATNESIFLTDTHVMNAGSEQFHIKQPYSGLDAVVSMSNVVIAASPEGDFNDIAVVKLPFIPTGVTAYPVGGSNICSTEEPADNAFVTAFAFPYINGGPRYTQYLMQGNVETLTDPSVVSAKCWYGNVQNVSPGVYIPTTMPVRVGASGALVLDQNMQGIGVVSAMSPGGAIVKPLNPTILQNLIAATGYVQGQ